MSVEEVPHFSIHGVITEHVFAGSVIRTVVELVNGQKLRVATHPEQNQLPIGTHVNLYWNPKKAIIVHTVEEQIYNVLEHTSNETYEKMERERNEEV